MMSVFDVDRMRICNGETAGPAALASCKPYKDDLFSVIQVLSSVFPGNRSTFRREITFNRRREHREHVEVCDQIKTTALRSTMLGQTALFRLNSKSDADYAGPDYIKLSMTTQDDKDELLLSCRYGDLDDVQLFVKQFGAESLADVRDDNGNTGLHMLCGNGHIGETPISCGPEQHL